ncbi:MAG: PIG-L family deacetylase [Melioribacteraceae bacterium]|nr:PIG-L family deacetylase [Melioribacteraceae bacterium]
MKEFSMRILYIYPHPDDESFGPASVMYKQRKEGHEVYLLTLTKGGATKQRQKFGYSIEEMGDVRMNEMYDVSKILKLTGMTVLDLPDSGLKEMDPREIEEIIKKEIIMIEPDVIVTYPVHGISGFQDHLVTHAVVKRVFLELSEKKWFPRRLAFTTVTKEIAEKSKLIPLKFSAINEIDCVIEVSDDHLEAAIKALDCYATYKNVIENSGIKHLKTNTEYFELYMEDFKPPIKDLFEKLPSS